MNWIQTEALCAALLAEEVDVCKLVMSIQLGQERHLGRDDPSSLFLVTQGPQEIFMSTTHKSLPRR